MSSQVDCPICMEVIELNKNCVTTECGHCFHASCLMTSVAHNGFGCPYCRAKMADEVPDEEEEWETDDEEELEEEETYDNYALRGFRFFWNNQTGNEHDQDDIDEEQYQEEENEEEQEDDINVPTTDFVAQKLREQGVTYEQLVHMLCNLDHDEFRESEQAERFEGELFGKIRIIVSNYTPEQAVIPEPVPPIVEPELIVPPVPVIDSSSQPKINTRRVILHV